MNELHLFAGAGGGILGGMLLGHTCVCAVEIEKYPRKVLLQRQRDGILPRFPIWDDIKTFDGKPWKGKVDVVCGGFPCQDISAAGKGAGIEGKRSGLWGEMARVIGEIQPRFVFVENSPLLVGRGLAVVLGDLAEMGYDARWCVLGADDVGAPHRRKRIWLLADAGFRRHGNQKEELRTGRNPAEQSRMDVADAIGSTAAGRGAGFGRRERTPGEDEESRTPRNAYWTTEPELGRVAHGVACRVDRLKAIGNGQVPLCAAVAFSTLKNEIK